MTKRRGASYRRQAAMLLAPAIVLAFTFFVPLTAFAEPDETEQQPIATSQFVSPNQEVYRVRATGIELQTPPSVETGAVIFISGGEEIPGVKSVSQSNDQYTKWNPTRNPSAGAVMTAKVGGEDVPGSVILRDNPMLTVTAVVQNDSTLTIKGDASGILTGTTIKAKLMRGADVVKEGDVSLPVSSSDLAQLQIADTPAGDGYSVILTAYDNVGEITSSIEFLPVTISSSVKEQPPTNTETPPIIPVKPSPDIYIPKIDIVPVELLSTNFSIPVAANIVANTKRSSIFQATAPPSSGEVEGVATEEQATVESVVDLTPKDSTVTPLAPTSGGWSLFGVSWYWWAGSVAAAWIAGLSLHLWLRKP